MYNNIFSQFSTNIFNTQVYVYKPQDLIKLLHGHYVYEHHRVESINLTNFSSVRMHTRARLENNCKLARVRYVESC